MLTPAGTLHAGQAVLTAPPALALERIDFVGALPADLVRLAQATPLGMGAVAKVVAHYPIAFWCEAGLAGASVSRIGPLQEIHDMSGPGGEPAALFGFDHARTGGGDGPGGIGQARPAAALSSQPSSRRM
ncbi:hypothetical protein ACFY8W_02530 [Streptomyces sp. NPDC012637]|uniref:hypothetical protein n=1 Tax=Streptomyces sp. NPDC012637 TaxID=3364842 RepID=UPI0036E40A45